MAILWVPTFELVCSSSSGLTFSRVYMWGGAVWLSCMHGGCWGELCGGCWVVGSCVSPVPPGGPHPLLLGGGVASSGQKKGPDLPNGAEVHKLSASQPLLVTTLSYYSVYCAVHQCVLSHTYIYTHTPRLLA